MGLNSGRIFAFLLLVIAILTLSGSSFATCGFNVVNGQPTTVNIDYAEVTYLLKDDSSAEVLMVFGVAGFEKECLLSEFVNVEVSTSNPSGVSVGTIDINSDEVPCPSKF